MLGTIEALDARLRRGLYRVTTHSGTDYFVEVHKSVAGGMRVISTGTVVKALRTGIVGGCGCVETDEPIIKLGRSMHLSQRGQHIVMTSLVRGIVRIENGSIDSMVCTHCKTGYRDGWCRICHM